MGGSRVRRDVERNRRTLIEAGRVVLSAVGPDATLSDIAQAAGVSRTTLHRHFTDRDDLFAAVFGDNVTQIEAKAAALLPEDGGLIELFHFALDQQFEAPALARVLSRRDSAGFVQLGRRTAAAFDSLLCRATDAGLVQPEVGIRDIMLALPMGGAAVIEDDRAGRTRDLGRVRALLHRGLFTTQPPGAR